jgi:hypothetical protein
MHFRQLHQPFRLETGLGPRPAAYFGHGAICSRPQFLFHRPDVSATISPHTVATAS